MSITEKATEALIARLGSEQVVTDNSERYAASMDNMRYSRMPAARIYPDDEAAIATVLKLANEYGIPVTTRGAGSATTGATSPSEGGWVLDLSRWRNLHIDPIARMAFVQPGVTLAELDDAAANFQLSYPPDPGSHKYSTIGGTIATNAGGMRGAKYGVTRDYVLSLEGFLATGEFVRWGANLKKFSAGYNIRDLWIGSEGTLGIITGAVMRLIPRPAMRSTCLAVFPNARAAIQCSQKILSSGITPSALEFLDSQTVSCTFSFWQVKHPHLIDDLPECLSKWQASPLAPAILIIEVDGDQPAAENALDAVVAVVKQATDDWITAIDDTTTELLWKIRRSCSQAMFELGPRKLNEDVVVPFEHQLDLLDFIEELHRETHLPTPTFGHAADGNFHAHIMYDDNNHEASEAAQAAVKRLMQKVVELGGSISGEHGIGMAKSPFFSLQHGNAEIAAMKAIKKALDPNNILNPGKLWELSEPWSFPRESVKMPWDH
jgi:glycolate oxidase